MQKQKTSLSVACKAWCGSCVAMLFLFILEGFLQSIGVYSPLLIGSFGASAVLLFAAPQSPFSHWRNVVFGHSISAFIGVSMYLILGKYPIIAASFAVSTAIACMYLSATLHPPGGATAFIAVMGGGGIHDLGYLYVLMPCFVGAVLLCFLERLTQSYVPRIFLRKRISV